MRTMFKETKQKCAWDQRRVRKTEMLKTDKMPTQQKTNNEYIMSLIVCLRKKKNTTTYYSNRDLTDKYRPFC